MRGLCRLSRTRGVLRRLRGGGGLNWSCGRFIALRAVPCQSGDLRAQKFNFAFEAIYRFPHAFAGVAAAVPHRKDNDPQNNDQEIVHKGSWRELYGGLSRERDDPAILGSHGSVTADLHEVPHGEAQGQNPKAVSHPGVMSMMDLPAAPECESGGHDHEDSTKWIQGDSFHWLNKSS